MNFTRQPLNILKGGNSADSPFYHSFGQFIRGDFSRFDTDVEDFPIDMTYQGFEELGKNYQDKTPHIRMVLKNTEERNITIKILCLHIRYS